MNWIWLKIIILIQGIKPGQNSVRIPSLLVLILFKIIIFIISLLLSKNKLWIREKWFILDSGRVWFKELNITKLLIDIQYHFFVVLLVARGANQMHIGHRVFEIMPNYINVMTFLTQIELSYSLPVLWLIQNLLNNKL